MLVADRLSALMLVLTGVVGLGAAVYAMARWNRAGVHFHPLFQIQLMGLNGAFLTGDLFNLFVFFEVMLAASYGLLLHGSGWRGCARGCTTSRSTCSPRRCSWSASRCSTASPARSTWPTSPSKLPLVPARDRGLLHAGAAILAMAFLTKAAIWPLNFWLVPAYTAASAPVAALFALMTKVGVYTLLRLWTLLVSAATEPCGRFGATVFLYGGLATLAFGALGLMASLRLGRIAAFSLIVVVGDAAGGDRARCRTGDVGGALLSAERDARRERAVPAGRAGRARRRGQHARCCATWSQSRAKTPTSTTRRRRWSAG